MRFASYPIASCTPFPKVQEALCRARHNTCILTVIQQDFPEPGRPCPKPGRRQVVPTLPTRFGRLRQRSYWMRGWIYGRCGIYWDTGIHQRRRFMTKGDGGHRRAPRMRCPSKANLMPVVYLFILIRRLFIVESQYVRSAGRLAG